MYNAHRGMVPAPNTRLTELLDQLRQEFDSQTRSTGEFEHQRMLPDQFPLPSLRWQCLNSYALFACPCESKAIAFAHVLKSFADLDYSYRAAPGNGDD